MKTKRTYEDGVWSEAHRICRGLYSCLHLHLTERLSPLKRKRHVSPVGEAPPNGDVMNKFEVLGIVGEGELLDVIACVQT